MATLTNKEKHVGHLYAHHFSGNSVKLLPIQTVFAMEINRLHATESVLYLR